jgi:hypothetical protein
VFVGHFYVKFFAKRPDIQKIASIELLTSVEFYHPVGWNAFNLLSVVFLGPCTDKAAKDVVSE